MWREVDSKYCQWYCRAISSPYHCGRVVEMAAHRDCILWREGPRDSILILARVQSRHEVAANGGGRNGAVRPNCCKVYLLNSSVNRAVSARVSRILSCRESSRKKPLKFQTEP